jgi:hypothetical protein
MAVMAEDGWMDFHGMASASADGDGVEDLSDEGLD